MHENYRNGARTCVRSSGSNRRRVRQIGIAQSSVEILINLAPAAVEKNGTWLDLPLAVIILQASGLLPDLAPEIESKLILFGELGIHGELRRVPGSLSLAFCAKPGDTLIVPKGNEKECALILAKPGHEGCRVYPAGTLEEVLEFFHGRSKLPNALKEEIKFQSIIDKALDFGRIRGQDEAKRAAVITAAGGHNLLLIGPPGEGKSLLASALPGILPQLTDGEKVELTRIYSAVGALAEDGQAVTRRPMRSVHHSVSMQALIGGGSGVPRPGEITMAHHGILFLDELPEFSRQALESVRQPLESGVVRITRVKASLEFPARFTLVAAMNPCPCGYSGSAQCTCDSKSIEKYQKKLSGPLLDRIDLQVEIKPLTTEERFAPVQDGESPKLRALVQKARQRQQQRFAGTDIPHNAAIPGGQVVDHCKFSEAGLRAFKEIASRGKVSTRTTDRLAKVARTVADLDDSIEVQPHHIEEAAKFVAGGVLQSE
ncbi:MAG TPA: YifB family Mg chelatase-like AAA ATPase [Candidatus Limnocylindria bacterium]|nr:YifB family Mg chelatase-like AAA ATPase [Candidatus Limnocylindria bacterium]